MFISISGLLYLVEFSMHELPSYCTLSSKISLMDCGRLLSFTCAYLFYEPTIFIKLLFQFFMDECLQRLVDKIDSDESLKSLTPSDCISKLIRFRLEMQAPYISTWPQALSIQVFACVLFSS